jgi:hypothetical protein
MARAGCMQRAVLVAMIVAGCAGSRAHGTSSGAPKPSQAAAPRVSAPRPPAWQVEARRDAVVHGTGAMTGYRLPVIGVIDVEGDRIFVQGADDRVDALVLGTGHIVFEADVRGVPIGLLPGNVAAVLDAENRLVLLDRESGERLFASDRVAIYADSIVDMTYTSGTLHIDSRKVTSAGRACCGGGPWTTWEASATIDLASGNVTGSQTSREGEQPAAPRRTQVPQVLPPSIHLQIASGASRAAPDNTLLVERSITISVADGPAWTHAIRPLHVPRPDDRPKPPLQ